MGVSTRAGLESQTGSDDGGFRGNGRVGASKRQGDVKNLKYSQYAPAFQLCPEMCQYYGCNCSQQK